MFLTPYAKADRLTRIEMRWLVRLISQYFYERASRKRLVILTWSRRGADCGETLRAGS